jgi:hypothetical protein
MLTRTARRSVIALSIVVLLVALYAVAGFWAVPHFLRSGLTDFVSTHYKRPLALGDIRFNPFTFTLDVGDFSLPDSDGQPMLAFGRLHVDLELKSLFRLGPSFREIVLERPQVRAVVRPDGTLNLADLGKGFPPQPASPPPTKPSEPMRLYVDRFEVSGGAANFEDLSHAKPFRAQFQPISFELRNFSTRAKSGADDENEYVLTAASPQGERLDWSGRVLLEPVSSRGKFTITDLKASTVWSYLQQPLPLEIPSGVVAIKGEYTFGMMPEGAAIKVDVQDATVADLRLRPRQATTDYVVLSKLDLQQTEVDVAKRSVEVGKVILNGGEVKAWLSPEGQLNLLELMGAPAASAAATGSGTTPGSSARAGSAAAARSSVAARSGVAAGPGAATAAGGASATDGTATAAGGASATDGTATAAGGASATDGTSTAAGRASATDGTSIAAGRASATDGTATAAGGAAASSAVAAPGAAAPAWSIAVPDITVEGLKVSAEDRQVKPVLALAFNDLNVHVSGYNTTAASRLDVTARTSFNSGASLKATAQLAPNGSGDTSAHVELAQLDLTMFQPFIAQRTAMTLKAGSLATQLDIRRGADGKMSVKGDVDVTGLRSVDELQQSFIKWKDLRIAGMQYDLQPASLHIDSITAREPYARVIIAPDRTVNVEVVLAGPNKGTPSLATQLGAANAKRGSGITPAASAEAKSAKANPAPAGSGASTAETNASTPAGNGTAAAANANPGAASTTAAQGKENTGGSKTAAAGKATAAGNATAAAANANPEAGSKTAGADNANPGAGSTTAAADNATAPADAAPRRGRKSKSGSATAAANAPAAAPMMPISIGTVRIIEGSANYADFWIQPNFAVGIQTLNGSIEGLSSDPKSRAKVKLEGKVDRYAPVTIDGQMNLQAAAVYSDIKMSFKGLELTTMTPYSGRFAGYKIDKGKLSVDLDYKIDHRVLTADQHFVIDQLQLGDRVESPDAVHLPLKLAVALLKDRNGVINVPLPITGSLDDPQFKIGPIIWHAVLNLFEKVATAPFAALGRLFGGGHGEEMKFVDFDPGSADLDAPSKEKLSALSKALQEHTQLQLDVPLVYSTDLDKPVLAKTRLDRRLIARAYGDKQPTLPPGLDPIQDPALTDPLRHYRLLLAEYQAELGKDAELPPSVQAVQNAKHKQDAPPVESAIPELEKALVDHSEVSDIALQDLAKRRAQGIEDALLAEGGVDAARIFVINGPAQAEDGKVRVEMALK